MTGTRPHSASVSTASSLLQDVPGAFPPTPNRTNDDYDDEHVAPQTLSQVVYARRSEYVRAKQVRIKVGTWNVAACKGTEKDVGGWFVGGKGVVEGLAGLEVSEDDANGSREGVAEQESRYTRKQPTLPKGDQGSIPGNDEIGLYVLGLQEVVDVGSATEALRPYTDSSVPNKWKDSMAQALPDGYRLIAEQQLIGLLLLIYAASDVAKDVKAISTTSVGTGLMGYMGNKGAVTARIVLGETTRLVFVNCHMGAGADKTALERRNWDAQQIISRTRFEPIQDAMDLSQTTGEHLGDEDFAFWSGDLNYRLEGIPGDDVRRLLMLHTRHEYDLSQRSAQKIENEIEQATNSVKQRQENEDPAEASSTTLVDEVVASDDPTSLQTTLSSLLPHDELHQQMQSGKAFHDGWREGPITFLPTYKYDPGTVGVFDSSEKKRAPSWCDRILYRTRRDKLAYEAKVREAESARRKDEEMKASGTDLAGTDEEILYDYDPDTDGVEVNDEYDEYENVDENVVITREGFEDEIELEYYTAHQRVLSSDHKPLDAVFLLKYDAVVPELKAKIHAEVARELDKAENEGRPNVTVVVDAHHSNPETNNDCVPEKFEGVWFGDVRWAQTKHRSLTIANTSRVPASFTFIERPTDATQKPGIAPNWLHLKISGTSISSSTAATTLMTLEPGETCLVELELRILTLDDVQDLNDNRRYLEDILVLRVENGRDHFIPVRANWQESSLGRSIDKLVRIPEGGIRRLQRQKPGSSRHELPSGAASPRKLSKGSEGSAPDEQQPVRFSAPRELFRLTEAVEELSTRVVAEWEMTNPPPAPRDSEDSSQSHEAAPWDDNPAWPFDEACWAERGTTHWDDALSEACNALDEDQPLEPSLPADLPRMQRLYVLCNMLLLFLRGMPDGVVTSELWLPVEKYIIDLDKAKHKPGIDDQRTAIQELLSQSPSHSISFVLITSMLERMIQDIVSASNAKESAQALSPTKKAGGTLKRMAHLGKLPSASRKELASAALAKMFVHLIIRSSTTGNEKARQAVERRKTEAIEIFLKRDEPG